MEEREDQRIPCSQFKVTRCSLAAEHTHIAEGRIAEKKEEGKTEKITERLLVVTQLRRGTIAAAIGFSGIELQYLFAGALACDFCTATRTEGKEGRERICEALPGGSRLWARSDHSFVAVVLKAGRVGEELNMTARARRKVRFHFARMVEIPAVRAESGTTQIKRVSKYAAMKKNVTGPKACPHLCRGTLGRPEDRH